MTTDDQNTIFVGAKPPMNYVLAIVTQFNGGAADVTLKARGRAIARAVDVAEIVRHRFVDDAAIRDIRIGTERVVGDQGRTMNVSSIEIVLTKDAAGARRHAIEPRGAPPARHDEAATEGATGVD